MPCIKPKMGAAIVYLCLGQSVRARKIFPKIVPKFVWHVKSILWGKKGEKYFIVYLYTDTVIQTASTLLDFHIAKNTRLIFHPRKDNRLFSSCQI